MTGTSRSHDRPGSPARRRRQSSAPETSGSSSPRSARSGRCSSATTSASCPSVASATAKPSSARCLLRNTRVADSGSAIRRAVGTPATLDARMPSRQTSFRTSLQQRIYRRRVQTRLRTPNSMAGVGAGFFECAGERFDVAVAEVLGEVLFDRVAVVAASLLHRRAALVGEDDEDRAAVVFGADSLDEAGLFESVDDAGEAALAVEDPLGELVHAQPVGRFLEVDEGVVPAQRDAGVALERGVEDVDERERALEVEPPGTQPLGGGV